VSQWIRIADVADCPPGHSLEVVAGENVVALFNVDGQFHALDGVCPHQGGPLGEGELCGAVVTCPWHGWQFDVRDGVQQINPNIRQPVYEVRVEGSDVFVRPRTT
jgi:nitrite reductase/ring-hydroxylating ferredoxin subunit